MAPLATIYSNLLADETSALHTSALHTPPIHCPIQHPTAPPLPPATSSNKDAAGSGSAGSLLLLLRIGAADRTAGAAAEDAWERRRGRGKGHRPQASAGQCGGWLAANQPSVRSSGPPACSPPGGQHLLGVTRPSALQARSTVTARREARRPSK
jgi:hypothetical protein